MYTYTCKLPLGGFPRNSVVKITDPPDMTLAVYSGRRGAQWPSGMASDSGARGRGFDTYLRRVVSLSKGTFTLKKVLVIPRKQWLHPEVTEKLFGTLSLNKTKPNSGRKPTS